MSYDIVYARQFIRTKEDRFVPLILIGSNNLTTTTYGSNGRNYERRVRNWEPLFAWGSNSRIDLSVEEILSELQKLLNSTGESYFEYKGREVGKKNFKRFIENCIKEAKTIEELVELNAGVEVPLDGMVVSRKKSDAGFKTTTSHYASVRSSEDLSHFLESAWSAVQKEMEESHCYIQLRFQGDDPVPYKKKVYKKPQERPKKYFVVRYLGDGRYVKRVSPRTMKLTYHEEGAVFFRTKSSAEKYIEDKRLVQRFGGSYDVAEVTN